MNFHNRTAIITGGAKGNGKGIAEVLAGHGVTVGIINRGDPEETVNGIRAAGGKVEGYMADVRDKESVRECVDAFHGKYGRIDILVNNAGVIKCSDFVDVSDEERDFHFDVNIKGTWNVTQCVLPYMMEAGYGRIITVSSVTGEYVADAGSVAYGTSKAALVGFAKCIAMEVANRGITSNAICPGYIRTSMVDNLAMDANPGDPQSVIDQFAAGIPLKRLGTPEDIGHITAYLASDEASFITGASIVIDGGCVLPETKTLD